MRRAIENFKKRILKILQDCNKQRSYHYIMCSVIKEEQDKSKFLLAIIELLESNLIIRRASNTRPGTATIGHADVFFEYNPYPKRNLKQNNDNNDLLQLNESLMNFKEEKYESECECGYPISESHIHP